MAILRTPFHEKFKGSMMMENEDWWTLLIDTKTGEYFVEHEWSHVDRTGGRARDAGRSEVPLAEFLNGEVDAAIKAKLNAVLGL